MLQIPSNGQHVFKVSIYNKDVRSLVKENLSHSLYDDEWADVHVEGILAADEAEAREIISVRYPPGDGFVIHSVAQATDDKDSATALRRNYGVT